jgi:hypothetical protein
LHDNSRGGPVTSSIVKFEARCCTAAVCRYVERKEQQMQECQDEQPPEEEEDAVPGLP